VSEFLANFADQASGICYVMALLGCLYALFAIVAVRSFAQSTIPTTIEQFPPILKPLFAVFIASFFGRRVEWRGQYYGVTADKTLACYE
jgi:hypothetical protein